MVNESYEALCADMYRGSKVSVSIIIHTPDGDVTAAHIPDASAHAVHGVEELGWWPEPGHFPRSITQIRITTTGRWTLYTPEFFQQPKQIEGAE